MNELGPIKIFGAFTCRQNVQAFPKTGAKESEREGERGNALAHVSMKISYHIYAVKEI